MSKKSNCLRMADGGELIKRWANSQRPALRMEDGGAYGTSSFATGGSDAAPNRLNDNFNQPQFQPGAGTLGWDAPKPSASAAPMSPSRKGGAMAPMPAPFALASEGYSAPLRDPYRMATGGSRAVSPPQPMRPSAPDLPFEQQTPIPDWMRRALRDGGQVKDDKAEESDEYEDGMGGRVPGKARGDTHPALYEGGEFVVSNAMMRRAPGLREELQELREETLEAQGKTVEEADAAQVKGGRLRAMTGADLLDPQSRFSNPPARPTNEQLAAKRLAEQTERAKAARLSAPVAPAVSAPNFTTSPGAAPAAPEGTIAWTKPEPFAGPGAPSDKLKLVPKSVYEAAAGAPKPTLRTPGGFSGDPMYPAPGEPTTTSAAPVKTPAQIENAQRFRAQPKAPPGLDRFVGEGKLPMPSTQSTLRQGVGVAKAVAPAALAGGAGAFAANKLRDIGNPDREPDGTYQTPEPFTRIPTDKNVVQRGPSAKVQPYNFFTDNETGRNIGNLAAAATAIPVVGPVMQTGRAALLGTAAVQGAGAQIINDRPVAPPPSVDPADQTAATRLRTGLALTGDNRGRGSINPTTTVQAADLTNFLAPSTTGKLPRNLDRLEAGQIYKTIDPVTGRVVYSGRDVKEGARMVGALGNELRQGGAISQFPGMQQAEIDRAVTNPDGSRWSARDNAIMAANLRDGVDPYRGTSRQAGEDAAARMANMERLAASPLGTVGRTNAQKTLSEMRQQATLRDNNAATLAQRDREALLQATTAAADRKLRADQFAITDGRAAEKHAQEVGSKSLENFKKEFGVFKDNKEDAEGSAQLQSTIRQIFPGIDSMTEQDRQRIMPDAKEMSRIFLKARDQDRVGWDALKFWEPKRSKLSAMPNAVGGKTEEVGPFAGLVMINGSNGDTLLTTKDGRTLNLGVLNDRQRELLARAKATGWGTN